METKRKIIIRSCMRVLIELVVDASSAPGRASFCIDYHQHLMNTELDIQSVMGCIEFH